MIPVVLASLVARAADPEEPGCAPLSEAALRALVADAKASVDRDDLVSFAERRKDLYRDLPCLPTPLPVDAWARFMLDEAVVAYALGNAWEASLGTALSLDPGLPRGDLPQELRTWVPPEEMAGGGALGAGLFRIDGRVVTVAPDLVGTHVVQRELEGVVTTRVLKDEPFPEDWRTASLPAPVPSNPTPAGSRGRGRPALVVAGLAVAVVGSAVGAGTWAVRGSVREAGTADQLVLANVGGWGIAAVGLAIGGVGLALPAPAHLTENAQDGSP